MAKTISNAGQQKEQYLVTIRKLRAGNFQKNLPFLILSDKLPEEQVYREFPDGRIEIQQVSFHGPNFESKVIHTLLPSDAERVRKEHELL